MGATGKPKIFSYHKQEANAALWFIIPSFFLLVVFVFYPMIRALFLSFNSYQLIGKNTTYIGIENYIDLLKDKSFLYSIWHSFYFAIIVIPIQTVIALGLALLIRGKFIGVGLFRTAYFLPVVIS
ncbi:MAG TPA: sugar ABC transporter permease, partial [Bacilli bacterium]